MRSLALLPVLAACNGKIVIGDTAENTYPAPDLMVSYESGPEASTAEVGQENFEIGCLRAQVREDAEDVTVNGILFNDEHGEAGSETILNAYLRNENGDTLMDGMADPYGNVGVRNDENPWVLSGGTDTTACLVVDFELYAGTAQVSLEAPDLIDDNSDEPYRVGGDPIDFDEVTVQ